MNVIGFDFGTTNSTISFYNTETKSLDCFQPSVSSNDYGKWTVVEKSVEECYTVTIRQNDNHFTIINTYQPEEPENPENPQDPQDPPELPNTGDSYALYLWIIVMCFVGILLIIIGSYGRKRR